MHLSISIEFHGMVLRNEIRIDCLWTQSNRYVYYELSFYARANKILRCKDIAGVQKEMQVKILWSLLIIM